MKKLLFPLALASAAFATSASAVDLGLGVSLNDQPTIYIPIEINDSLRIEPFLARTEEETTTTTTTLFLGIPITTATSVTTTDTEVGTGAFFKMKNAPNVQTYAGGRLSWIIHEMTGANDQDGFRIAPTAGMEYYFNNKFSVGGEAAVYYMDLDNYNAYGTATKVMLRYTY